MNNIFRGIIFFGFPLAGYFLNEKSPKGLLIGLGLGAIIVSISIFADRVRLTSLLFGGTGALLGAILARLVIWFVNRADNPTLYEFVTANSALITAGFALLGGMVAIQKIGELDVLDKDIVIRGGDNADLSVVDTSVLIDGRIADIAETGFLPGKLLVPRFVLTELQMVADSSDSTKRQRGRRGLDILKRLQENQNISLKIYDKDFSQIKEVDTKVVELAKEMGGKVATTDFNLSKVAALQGISVLNVNDLAAALKPVVLPGDSMPIFLVKEGKEKAQAVGYLDDGTMVVVDEARKSVGKRVSVLVNSILQTSAGRMIFARLIDTPSGKENGHKKSDDTPEDKEHAG